MPKEKKQARKGKAAAPTLPRKPVELESPEAVYTADQSILIVGDGNLSFAFALCTMLGGGSKVTSTTYDTLEELKKYPETASIIEKLNAVGSRTMHGVDATNLNGTYVAKLQQAEARSGETSTAAAAAATADVPVPVPVYDRVIFQFPLAHPPETAAQFKAQPDPLIQNKLLLRKFLIGATKLLAKNGEIHITSKEVKPYSWWRIHTLANGLPNTAFVGKLGFDPKRYPGYESRKPVNLHSDRVESFQFTNSTVFVFAAVAGTRPAAELTPPYYCSICEIDTLSPKNLAGHKTGKKHKLFAAIAGRWKTALEAMATEDLITAGGACGGGNSGP